jgi:hypothetical protein
MPVRGTRRDAPSRSSCRFPNSTCFPSRKRIHLVNTDPPYNVKVEPRSNNAIAAGLSSFSAQHHQQLDVARHPSKSKGRGYSRRTRKP